MDLTLITLDGQKVYATDSQISAIEVVNNAAGGRFAAVKGYSSETGYVTRPVQDIVFRSLSSTSGIYNRRIAALTALSFSDIASKAAKDEKLSQLSAGEREDVFNTRKAMLIDSMQKTLDGDDRTDAHRQGHDRCYVSIRSGVKAHYVTEKGDDNLKHPVLTNGYPRIASIMITALFQQVRTIVEGTRKVVNSGAPVRMSNIISGKINTPDNTVKMLSLKCDNFDTLKIDRQFIDSEFDLEQA